jgi:L-xylulokinase
MSTSPSSASNLDWLVRIVGPYDDAGRPDAATAVARGLAVDATDVPLFLPYLYGSPHGAAAGAAIGASFAQVRGWHGRDHLLRAALEGVVFNHRTHPETLGTGFRLAGPVRLCGGGARTPGWSQLLADAVGLPVEVTDTDEAGARGAALLAGVGVGGYASLAEASAAAVRVARRHEPQPDAALEERYRRYLALVAAAPAAAGGS